MTDTHRDVLWKRYEKLISTLQPMPPKPPWWRLISYLKWKAHPRIQLVIAVGLATNELDRRTAGTCDTSDHINIVAGWHWNICPANVGVERLRFLWDNASDDMRKNACFRFDRFLEQGF
jgi:hypothetical protein